MTVAHGFEVQREPVGKGITARITLPGDCYGASSDAVPRSNPPGRLRSLIPRHKDEEAAFDLPRHPAAPSSTSGVYPPTAMPCHTYVACGDRIHGLGDDAHLDDALV